MQNLWSRVTGGRLSMDPGVAGPEALVTVASPRSPAAEAYRTLRTSIQFSSLDRPIRTLLVTSTGPDEGKSTTAANLAAAFAQGGANVVLVDCDLRRPSQHRIFGTSNSVGLTNLMIQECGEASVSVATEVPNLCLIPSGPLPPNPAELLGSRKMLDVIGEMTARADLVLLDTPPIVAVSDAAVLASKVDAALLVIRAGVTKRDHARRAKEMLAKVNANVIGVVLNNVKFDPTLHRYYAESASRA